MSTNSDKHHRMKDLIAQCLDEKDINKKIEMFNEIRSKLGDYKSLKVPSMVTDDYINYILQNVID